MLAILGGFERKNLRAVFGPTNDNGEWRIKYSNELYTLYKGSDIVTYIKINRLKWDMLFVCRNRASQDEFLLWW